MTTHWTLRGRKKLRTQHPHRRGEKEKRKKYKHELSIGVKSAREGNLKKTGVPVGEDEALINLVTLSQLSGEGGEIDIETLEEGKIRVLWGKKEGKREKRGSSGKNLLSVPNIYLTEEGKLPLFA